MKSLGTERNGRALERKEKSLQRGGLEVERALRRRQRAMCRQGMRRHNASSGGTASLGGNASSGNVSSQCAIRG